MPHYAIVVGPVGPLLQVYVGVSQPRLAALVHAGQTAPPPILASLLVDTGASISGIDSSVIAQLGLQPTGTTLIRTPSTGATPHSCSTYDVSLMIPGPAGTAAPKIFPAIPIVDGQFLPQGHHGLLGRDALSDAQLIYSGPNRVVMLSF
jgi:hypothetical protein